jgi:hypothetical protein
MLFLEMESEAFYRNDAMETPNVKEYLKPVCNCYNKENLRLLSDICLYLGFVSIVGSILAWFTASKEDRAYGERFGIFIGLWVPSFFILSNRLSRKAEELPDTPCGE